MKNIMKANSSANFGNLKDGIGFIKALAMDLNLEVTEMKVNKHFLSTDIEYEIIGEYDDIMKFRNVSRTIMMYL
jgi:hypothetical protein